MKMYLRIRERIHKAIESFSIFEKIIFFVLFFLLAISALLLSNKVNNLFTEEVPAPGGEISEGIIGFPRYINPLLPVTDAGRDLATLIYSGLFKANQNGEIVPDLAEKYEVSEDGLRYKITLKNNVTFHDDAPVTAYDVEFTIKKALDPILKSPKAANWAGITIQVLSSNEIEFILKKAYAPFLQNLTQGILPIHIWKDVDSDAFVFSQYNFEPIGSGPYKISDIKRNKSGLPEFYRLTPFNNYAGGTSNINDLYFHFYTNEEDLLDAFKKGVVSNIGSLSPESIVKIEGDSDIIRTPLPRIFGLFFNQNENEIFRNLEVRQALSEAVDRKKIIEKVLAGFGTPINGPLPYNLGNESSNDINDSENIEEKIQNAKNILIKAGWKEDENGLMTKKEKSGTKNLEFSISTGAAVELKGTAEVLKETWQKIGAKVEIKIFELSDLQQNIIRPRKYDSLLFGEVIGRELDLYAFWHSSERNDPGLNISLYTNSKADKFLENAREITDPKKRLENLIGFQDEVKKDIPAIFLFSPDFVYIVPKKLKGLNLDYITTTSDRFLNVNNWFIETERVWSFFKK